MCDLTSVDDGAKLGFGNIKWKIQEARSGIELRGKDDRSFVLTSGGTGYGSDRVPHKTSRKAAEVHVRINVPPIRIGRKKKKIPWFGLRVDSEELCIVSRERSCVRFFSTECPPHFPLLPTKLFR
jgi:hypothetical protein